MVETNNKIYEKGPLLYVAVLFYFAGNKKIYPLKMAEYFDINDFHYYTK